MNDHNDGRTPLRGRNGKVIGYIVGPPIDWAEARANLKRRDDLSAEKATGPRPRSSHERWFGRSRFRTGGW